MALGLRPARVATCRDASMHPVAAVQLARRALSATIPKYRRPGSEQDVSHAARGPVRLIGGAQRCTLVRARSLLGASFFKRVCAPSSGKKCRDIEETMRWMHYVRLYPTRRQGERLRMMLDVTRQLYNALLDRFEKRSSERSTTAFARMAKVSARYRPRWDPRRVLLLGRDRATCRC